MNTITIQWCAFKSLAGRLVDFGTQGTVGHASLVMPSGELLDAQNESGLGGKPSGLQLRPAGYISASGGYNLVRVILPTTDDCAEAAYAWATSLIGESYDLLADIGIAFNEDWSTPGKAICSGFCSGVLTQPNPAFFGYPLAKDWRIISPEQLLLICSAFAPVIPC